jgi:hypothetical protein
MRASVLLFLGISAFAQSTNPVQVRERGQVHPPDGSQSWTRGRLGTQQPLPSKVQQFSGILVDASCDDRSALNLQQQPAPPTLAVTPSVPNGAPGVKVDPKTLQRERADAMAQQTPDVVNRQPDRSCSVNGSTKGFALLLPNGRLLNFDEGGNTLAMQGLQGTPDGRAMLNGTTGGIKPQVTLTGRVQGDRLIVDKIVKL